MHFSKVELCNYGIYKGQHSIELSGQGGDRNITLVGGMNGRGKTTILDAIFLCLYGRKAIEYITGKKEAYATVLKDRINKSANNSETHIRLDMDMDDDTNTTLSVIRGWKDNGGRISSSLHVIKNGVDDTYLSQNWEYYVEELIPYGIAKFFFFDNEKISQIADDEAFDKVKDSIKSVMGVTTIESLISHLSKIVKEKDELLQGFENSEVKKELDVLTSELDKVEASIRELRTQRASIVPRLERLTAELEAAEQDFWKAGGNLSLKHDEIVQEKNRLKEAESETHLREVNMASAPSTPLCLCKGLVVQAYNSAKSCEDERARQYSAPIVNAIHKGLLDKCREQYGADAIYSSLCQMIEHEFEPYRKVISHESSAVLSPLSLALIEKFINEEFTKLVNLAAHLREQSETNENMLLQIDVHLSSNAEKAGAAQLLENIKDLEAQRTTCQAQLAKCDEDLHSQAILQEATENKRNRTHLKIAEMADTNDDNARIMRYATMSIEVMHKFIKRLQIQKVAHLEDNITKCFKYLAQKEAIITSIRINPDTLDITLQDYKGGILLKEQLSAGEKQMFAISILWGLALSSGYKLPVIIDTPMARLDSAHRSNFINRYLPNASSQVIVLSTDEEVYGRYLEEIRSHVNAYYTLVYDEAEKCSTIVPGYFGGAENDL